MRELLCNSWEDLNGELERISGGEPYTWIFRGQEQAVWRLQPSLERSTASDLALLENDLRAQFASKAHLWATHTPAPDDKLGWLSMMQHYGVPTRLLDFTYSAYIALYFAALPNKLHQDEDDHAAVWAIDLPLLRKAVWERAEDLPARGSTNNRQRFYEDTDFNKIFSRYYNESKAPSGFPGLVVPLRPVFEVSRLSSQQGCFLFNCNPALTFHESLQMLMETAGGAKWGYKLVFPRACRQTALKHLMHLNVHPLSLFQDISGLASFITLKTTLFPTALARCPHCELILPASDLPEHESRRCWELGLRR